MLPDDWRYEFIVDALDAIADHEDEDEARDSIEADIYTAELTGWLHSRVDRYEYCDNAAQEFGASDTLLGSLQLGQLMEKHEVFDSVLSSLRDQLETLETEDE